MYAHAEDTAEFEEKNMLLGEGSAEALGVDVAKGLPGLYWLNFFGSLYYDFMGLDRLLMPPRSFAKKIDEGLLIRTGESAAEWNTPERRISEAEAVKALGPQYFFSKADVTRPTIGPPLPMQI